jgi:hypothetical protein
VIVGTSTATLSAIVSTDGTLASSYALPSSVKGSNEAFPQMPLTGLAAAENRVIVPVGGTLMAF